MKANDFYDLIKDDRYFEHRWFKAEEHLCVWIPMWYLDEILEGFKFIYDGCEPIPMMWMGDCMCIDHFERFIKDWTDEEVSKVFPLFEE